MSEEREAAFEAWKADPRYYQWNTTDEHAALNFEAGWQAGRQSADDEFKNFHCLLCERFDYSHDEKDWKRDQLSLIEWIAGRPSAGATGQEPVGIIECDETNGWHVNALVDWEKIGLGTKLYAAPIGDNRAGVESHASDIYPHESESDTPWASCRHCGGRMDIIAKTPCLKRIPVQEVRAFGCEDAACGMGRCEKWCRERECPYSLRAPSQPAESKRVELDEAWKLVEEAYAFGQFASTRERTLSKPVREAIIMILLARAQSAESKRVELDVKDDNELLYLCECYRKDLSHYKHRSFMEIKRFVLALLARAQAKDQ